MQLVDACPKCGAPVELGYGLAYGGFGAYQYCARDCGWHEKDRACPYCEAIEPCGCERAKKEQG